jgi:hypothetical protein
MHMRRVPQHPVIPIKFTIGCKGRERSGKTQKTDVIPSKGQIYNVCKATRYPFLAKGATGGGRFSDRAWLNYRHNSHEHSAIGIVRVKEGTIRWKNAWLVSTKKNSRRSDAMSSMMNPLRTSVDGSLQSITDVMPEGYVQRRGNDVSAHGMSGVRCGSRTPYMYRISAHVGERAHAHDACVRACETKNQETHTDRTTHRLLHCVQQCARCAPPRPQPSRHRRYTRPRRNRHQCRNATPLARSSPCHVPLIAVGSRWCPTCQPPESTCQW